MCKLIINYSELYVEVRWVLEIQLLQLTEVQKIWKVGKGFRQWLICHFIFIGITIKSTTRNKIVWRPQCLNAFPIFLILRTSLFFWRRNSILQDICFGLQKNSHKNSLHSLKECAINFSWFSDSSEKTYNLFIAYTYTRISHK